MQINFDTYSYAAKASSEMTKRNRSVKKEVNTDKGTNSKKQLPVSSKTQSETEAVVRSQKNNEVTKDIEDKETTFPSVNIFKKYEKYAKALNEHYFRVNEENKKFSNPEKHIQDKYFNKKSPYYVGELTQKERKICAKAERDVLNGIPPAINAFDPVLQEKFGGCNIFIMDMEANQEVREDMNDAIKHSLEENGITIPNEAALQLTIDPYEFYIRASGVDEDLATRIEEALNKGKNGYNLYQHISLCNPVNYGVAEPAQYISGDREKMAVYHLVDRLTGYDIRELEHKDGKFYTPDGEDLWKVLTDKYNEQAAADGSGSFGLGEYYAEYRRIAEAGWDRTQDSNLSITYKNGSLHDMDTSYGYGKGQTDWQERVKNWYEQEHESYQKERAETLQRGKSTPAKEEKEEYQLTAPDLSKLQTILERLQRDGLLIPLSDKVLSLHEESQEIQSFDKKA